MFLYGTQGQVLPSWLKGEGLACLPLQGTSGKGGSEKWDFLYYGPMCMSVKKAAQSLIRKFQVDEGLLNMIEMAFTAYDPCMAWVIPYSAP